MHRFQKWRDALQAAGSQRSVTRVMREYAHTLPDEVRASLPEPCRDALADPIDVLAAAVTFLHAELAHVGPGEEQAFLHEIAHTFAAAAMRYPGLPDVTQPNAAAK
jgi:hypothetical protein